MVMEVVTYFIYKPASLRPRLDDQIFWMRCVISKGGPFVVSRLQVAHFIDSSDHLYTVAIAQIQLSDPCWSLDGKCMGCLPERHVGGIL